MKKTIVGVLTVLVVAVGMVACNTKSVQPAVIDAGAAVVAPVLHKYVPPPDAVIVALWPAQIVTVAGVIAGVGNALTVVAGNVTVLMVGIAFTVAPWLSKITV